MNQVFRKLVLAVSVAAALCIAPSDSFAQRRGNHVSPQAHQGHHGNQGHHNNRSNRNRNIGIGIAAAAAAAILLSQGARASSRHNDDDHYSHRDQCRRWDRRCDDGADWACRKYRREC